MRETLYLGLNNLLEKTCQVAQSGQLLQEWGKIPSKYGCSMKDSMKWCGKDIPMVNSLDQMRLKVWLLPQTNHGNTLQGRVLWSRLQQICKWCPHINQPMIKCSMSTPSQNIPRWLLKWALHLMSIEKHVRGPPNSFKYGSSCTVGCYILPPIRVPSSFIGHFTNFTAKQAEHSSNSDWNLWKD